MAIRGGARGDVWYNGYRFGGKVKVGVAKRPAVTKGPEPASRMTTKLSGRQSREA